ncbi:hypothetical protein [Larkinella rosea]|uniref:Uncharacterized protein n=1 Tax=Larkinella rosea TaxID=2025312 RepID=A0A3P1BEK1_9BACT|nr:hypothetical protein [Larkinella rosea]RRA99023.1 hypothetical protein EHT25_29010 [Larkinella rosea]
MSQHPIDDLFARQLRDHGVKPQRATWDELQRRMNEKEERKSPFIWWYASAASVAVILLASWWLWSGDETGKPNLETNRIAQQIPKKTAPTNPQSTVRQTEELKPIESTEETVLAFEKTARLKQESKTHVDRQTDIAAPETVQEPAVIEKPATPVLMEEVQKPQTLLAEVPSKEPERTLVVQIAAPEIKSASLMASTETALSEENAENTNDQPRRKRFRLGRVLRQINKLKAGESVEWDEVGVQPGALLARASEKVHEGKEKLADSYENLRYNAFKKNPNNK